jgi:hypothetical protein
VALGPDTPAVAEAVPAEVVTVDEPGVQAGEEVRRRAGNLGVDRDDRGADEPVAHVMSRQWVESLDRKGPSDGDRRDADLGRRLHERLLTDAPELGQRFLLVVRELARPPEHAANGLTIEELLGHRRSA